MIKKRKKKLNDLSIGGKLFTYSVYLLAAAFVLIPIYIMCITSVTSWRESNASGFRWWPEQGITWASYIRLEEAQFLPITLLQSLLNTLIIYLPTTAVGCVISALSAYAFAKLKFRSRDAMWNILVFTMTLPNIMAQTAQFLMFEKVGWIDTLLPLMIPRLFGTIASVFFLRNYIMSIPGDVIGAARVDGLGEFGIFWRIILPVCMPAILSRFVLEFASAYSEYMTVLLYLPSRTDLSTISLALSFYNPAYLSDYPMTMTCAVVSTIPLLIMYIASQKFILKGMQFSSSMKG